MLTDDALRKNVAGVLGLAAAPPAEPLWFLAHERLKSRDPHPTKKPAQGELSCWLGC